MTTIINTHDMNSVLGIGDNIIFICRGRKEWEGDKTKVMTSTNKDLNELVFASELFKKVKDIILSDPGRRIIVASAPGKRFEGDEKLNLSDRVYICPKCGLELDRDVNAARNILKFSKRKLAGAQPSE